MKFFTRGFANGEFDDDECERTVGAYRDHLAKIRPTLSPDARSLADVGLHDALIDRVRWNEVRRRLSITFVAFGPDGAVATVTIDYDGALLGEQRVDALRRAATSRETSVLDHEVDRDGELLVHRVLFFPSEEVTIDCADLRVEVVARPDERVFLHGAFVEER